MYPLLIQPDYLEKIWAGNKMSKFHSNSSKKSGIAWELSAHPNASTKISNGQYKGKDLIEVISIEKEKLIGTSHTSSNSIPIRLALMDASEYLSVQVHPNQEYAQLHNNDNGKNELWYIIEADSDAKIIAGTNQTDPQKFIESIQNQTLEENLIYIPVKTGDLINIPQGLVHALGKNILAIEVGQNSDTTYRIYDYDRGRPLDIEKSMDVIDLTLSTKVIDYKTIQHNDYIYHKGFDGLPYTVDLIDIINYFESTSHKEYFESYTCINGSCTLTSQDGNLDIQKGDTIMIPATLGNYRFTGSCKLLRAFTK